jgi:formylglycine-generating enzyme required for sulfatase activity
MRLMSRLLVLFFVFSLIDCGNEPEIEITTEDGATMLFVQAGEFSMGGKEEDLAERPNSGYLNYESERPLHQVKISPFYLDKFEVTNQQYDRFLIAVKNAPAGQYDHPDRPAALDYLRHFIDDTFKGESQPAVGLSWFDAYTYCAWANKRLPTEAEWEYAARGGDGVYRKYPWGQNAPNADGIWWANYHPQSGKESDGFRVTAPVGSFPDGVSPFGFMDMVGNAEEWVNDWHSFNYYKNSDGAQDPPGPLLGKKRVIKGGAFSSDQHHIRIATRFYGKPEDKSPNLGFRCARSL